MGSGVPGSTGVGGGPGGIDVTPPGDPCAATACVKAKADFNASKARVEQLCERLKWAASVAISIQKWIERINWWIVIVIAVLAIICGLFGLWFLMWILIALIVIFVIVYLVFLTFFLVAKGLADALAKEAQTLQQAVEAVKSTCPTQCWGDLGIPGCDAPAVSLPQAPDILTKFPWPWR